MADKITYLERLVRMAALLKTDKFLETLLEVGKLYGWEGDYYEIGSFIQNLYYEAGIKEVNTDPYEIIYE